MFRHMGLICRSPLTFPEYWSIAAGDSGDTGPFWGHMFKSWIVWQKPEAFGFIDKDKDNRFESNNQKGEGNDCVSHGHFDDFEQSGECPQRRLCLCFGVAIKMKHITKTHSVKLSASQLLLRANYGRQNKMINNQFRSIKTNTCKCSNK